jgi:sugar (pentulose or hexulose) kinase
VHGNSAFNCDLLAALAPRPRVWFHRRRSRSAASQQIKADVLGMPVDAAASGDAGIVGLAMVCAVASGEFSGYEKAAAAMVPKGVTYLPRRRCDEKLTRYRRARAAVRAIDGGGAP